MLIMELDIPKLIVNINEKFLNSKVNTNEYIKFSVQLSEDTNPEKIQYSAAIIYNLEIVGTQTFKFKEFRLKLWEFYDNYSEADNYVQIRA